MSQYLSRLGTRLLARRSQKLSAIYIALVVLFALQTALAAPGDLDPTFNSTGIVTTAVTNSNDVANAVAVQSDGKIVVAGYSSNRTEFVLARYTTSGALDTTFGTGGIVRNASLSAGINAIALQADGKIVVGGYLPQSGNSNRQFAVARYLASGSLDTTFGSGGIVTTPVGTSALDSEVYGIAIQSDGKIVATGYADGKFGTARYNSNGSLDTTFNSTGTVVTVISGGGIPKAVRIQSDGKIVVAGGSGPSTTVLARYNTNGSLDSSFDSDGIVTTAVGNGSAMVIQADGNIVVTASNGNDYNLIRYTTNGSLDTGFGTNGIVTTNAGGSDLATGVALDASGNILVTGSSDTSKSSFDIFLSRHTSNGTLDPVFDGGGDGIVTTNFGTYLDQSNAIALQPDGKIVIAGSLRDGATADDLVVARYVGTAPTTAANVTLGGRIINSGGVGVTGVRVILSGGSLPEPRVALANSFGFYTFYDVPAGHTYILTPEGRYTFSPTSLVINLTDEFLEANFTAN